MAKYFNFNDGKVEEELWERNKEALHDYFSGMMSERNDGASIAEITGKYLGPVTVSYTHLPGIRKADRHAETAPADSLAAQVTSGFSLVTWAAPSLPAGTPAQAPALYRPGCPQGACRSAGSTACRPGRPLPRSRPDRNCLLYTSRCV